MSQLGFSVMVNMLVGNEESVKAFTGVVGKTISAVYLDENSNALRFTFEGGDKIRLFDDGQSCCESRYMRTDDKLEDFIGAVLEGAEIKDGPEPVDDGNWDVHETQFLEVKTSKGSFVMSNHVEHNGYYGGFSIRAEVEE